MDKISRIVPNSTRTTAVDFSKERPVRPGAPGFGRPDGRADIRDRVTLSSLTKTTSPHELSNYRNTRESQRAAVVERISNDFFNTKPTPPPEAAPAIVEPSFEPASNEESSSEEVSSIEELTQPMEGSEIGLSPIEIRRQINFRPLAVDR